MAKTNKKGYLIHDKDFHSKNENHSKRVFYIICKILGNIVVTDSGKTDRYKYDIEIYSKKKKKYIKIEFENRSKKHFDCLWNKIYDSLDIPERKKHYNNISDIYIVTCNNDYSRFLFIKDFQKLINRLKVYSKYNKYSQSEETFIKIPFKYIKKIDLRKLKEKKKEKYLNVLSKKGLDI